MSSRVRLGWLACLGPACAGGGSGGDTGTAPDCLGTPTVEVGTGTDAFEPLSDGADLTMAFGPQGGWHLTASLHLAGVSDIVKLHPTATATSVGFAVAGEQLPENRELTSCDPASCACEALDLRVFLDVGGQADVCRLEGEQVEIVVAVTDLTTGAAGEGRRTITAQLDPVDVAGCHP